MDKLVTDNCHYFLKCVGWQCLLLLYCENNWMTDWNIQCVISPISSKMIEPTFNIYYLLVPSVCLSWGSALREGKDAYIPVAFGQSVDVYLVSK